MADEQPKKVDMAKVKAAQAQAMAKAKATAEAFEKSKKALAAFDTAFKTSPDE